MTFHFRFLEFGFRLFETSRPHQELSLLRYGKAGILYETDIDGKEIVWSAFRVPGGGSDFRVFGYRLDQ